MSGTGNKNDGTVRFPMLFPCKLFAAKFTPVATKNTDIHF